MVGTVVFMDTVGRIEDPASRTRTSRNRLSQSRVIKTRGGSAGQGAGVDGTRSRHRHRLIGLGHVDMPIR